MGAAPRKDVIRETSDPGDMIILLGGRTGRDGIGGATGSSKVHTEASIEVCGAEVQKGNAPTERKIQRLFRRPEVSRIIKKCNDFGAGGVSVAIGELAARPADRPGQGSEEICRPGRHGDRYFRVPGAYGCGGGSEGCGRIPGLCSGGEPGGCDRWPWSPRSRAWCMNWRGKTIVDISRAFLDTNGAHQEADRSPGDCRPRRAILCKKRR